MAIQINGILVSNIVSGILAYSDSIWDKNLNKFQSEINEDLRNTEEVYATYTVSATGILSNIKLYKDAAHTTQVTPVKTRIYLDVTAGSSYEFIWDGTSYRAMGGTPLAIGEVAGSAFDGLRGKTLEDNLALEITQRVTILGMTTEFVMPSMELPASQQAAWDAVKDHIINFSQWCQFNTETMFITADKLQKAITRYDTILGQDAADYVAPECEEGFLDETTSISDALRVIGNYAVSNRHSVENIQQAIIKLPTSGNASEQSFQENETIAKLYVAELDALDQYMSKNGAYLYMGDRWDTLQHYDQTKVTIY